MSFRSSSPDSTPPIVTALSLLISVLALIAAGAGLFRGSDGETVTVTSVWGQPVELDGQGLYRHDTLFTAGGQRGTDVIVLALAIPLLIASLLWYRRGSVRGGLLLSGVLAYLLYVYASAALGTVAYNDLFLVYVALFAATLFALILTLHAIGVQGLHGRLSPRTPHRWLARFLVCASAVTLVVWLMGPVGALVGDDPPNRLDTYSTLVTHALDLAIIVPLTLISAALVRRRDPLGYLIAFPLLGIIVLLGPTFVAQTVGQLEAGVDFTTGEIIGPISGFGLVAILATWVLISLFGAVAETERP